MTHWTSVAATLLVPISLVACGDSAGAAAGSGSGDGGGANIDDPCDVPEDCARVECPCRSVEGHCEFVSDVSEDKACVSAAQMCERIGCPLDEASAAGTGGASAGSSASSSTSSTGSGDEESSSSASGSGTDDHPECVAYANGNCACTYTGSCPADQFQELVDYCDGFFDTPFMQCAIGCATGSGSCSDKSECVYACE